MLSDFRVLDCTNETGFLAGKILGDLGADVVKLEPPGGDPARRHGPFLGDLEDAERALGWLALNTSKRGITLDVWQDEGKRLFLRLLGRFDVLIESYRPGTLGAHAMGWRELHQENPRLVHCAITPFGQEGPHAGYRGSDLTVVAMGGNAALTGQPDGPPVRCSMPTSYYHGAAEAALGVTMALHVRESSGHGQFVDVSLQECQPITTVGAPGRYAVEGRLDRRRGGRTGKTREIWQARDGWVSFGLRAGAARLANLHAMVAYMASCNAAPDWLLEFDWSSYHPTSASDAELQRLEDVFAAFFRTRRMRELYEEALKRRILLAPCNDAREILEQPQLRSRDFFVTLDYPELGASIEHPAFFARSSRHALRVKRHAPRLGEHNTEVFGELGIEPSELSRLARAQVI